MGLEITDLWKLIFQSQLLSREQCQRLNAQFLQSEGKADPRAKKLAEWLIRQKALSKYQAKILLAGRPGPFLYGDYKVYDRIESGRLAGFFRALHVGTNHPVLLKFLAGHAASSGAAWEEMQSWIPLTSHPNVSRCFEAVDLETYKFLVFEELPGQSWLEALEKMKRIGPEEASRMACLAATALAWLHENGRVHGDVRPHNLWLDPHGNVKLLLEPDVGTRNFNVSEANDREIVTRADYAAPEYMQPGRLPDAFTDIYALGSSLYHILAGKPPFPGGDVSSKLHRHATEPIQPLDALGVPPPLMQLIAYTMAKNPAVRYQQAAVVAEQLGPFVGAAKHNFRAQSPAPSLAAMEDWLQQKRAAVATPAVVVPGNAPAAAVAPAAVPAGLVDVSTSHRTSSAVLAVRRKARMRQRKNIAMLILMVMVFVTLVIGGVVLMNRPMGSSSARARPNEPEKPRAANAGVFPETPGKEVDPASGPESADPVSAAATRNAAPSRAASGPAGEVDEGQSLWSAPTHGPAISLDYVPPGGQLFLVARPSDILASEEGRRVLKALGPQFASTLSNWQTASGCPLDEIEQMVVTLFSNQGRYPRVAVTVRTKAENDPEMLREKWGSPAPVEGMEGVFQKGDMAYCVSDSDKRVFVMGPLDPEIKDVAAAKGKPPLLRREMGQLLNVSDSQRHATILFAPNFLLADGQELFQGERAKAWQALDWFLGDGLKAGMIGLHFSENFYFEMRMESDIQIDQYQLASRMRERLAQVPESIELHIARINPHPYWRLVAMRYPGMIRFLHQQTRIGVEGSHAVVNAVLPDIAAHNLVFGGEMMLASGAGTQVASAATAPGAAPVPKNIEEVLRSKISIAFAADSLEFAMQNVVSEVKAAHPGLPFEFAVKILGTDLEKDGITRNQQVRDFNHQDKSVADVLTAMVMKANPVTTVKTPDEPNQKLIWVVGPDPANNANMVVLITTRAAAEQKKYVLPEVFRQK